MNSFLNTTKLILLFIFSVLILSGIIGCKDDDEGLLTLDSSTTEASAARGQEVSITIAAKAPGGIESITASSSENGIFEFILPAGSPVFSGQYEFLIPGDAKLTDRFEVSFTMKASDNNTKTLVVPVTVKPVLNTSPVIYDFSKDGNTSVSFSGQNERLEMVGAIKSYLTEGDLGNLTISAEALNAAYANEGGNGNGFFGFTSTNQLRDKTFLPDLDVNFMENLFAGAEAASGANIPASSGKAGFLFREGSNNRILVDENGREFTQLIEKGLMGTVMLNQIYNTYFSDERTGDDVENTTLSEGKNYTALEHHWDEAYGYFNPPADFTSNWPTGREDELRFWSDYSNVVDPFLGTNDKLMTAFLKGRTAIVNNDLEEKNRYRTLAAEQLEIVTAATTVHYINTTIIKLNQGDNADAFHSLSEAWAFANALIYNPNRRISLAEIEAIKNTDFGTDGNFWNVSIDGLNIAKTKLVAAFPELENVKNQL